MADLAFDIYPADDPRNGSLLVRLTKADFLDGTSYRSVLRGTGSGMIVIHSEHAAVQAGHLSADNYVRVIDLGYDEIIGGFFLMEGEETVLSRDEQGGEIRSYGGPGTLSYLARATFPNVLRSDADEELGQHQAYVDATGYLRFTGPETYGGVLGRIIYEARLDEPSAVPDLPAHSWDDVEDSGGTNWTTFTGEYDIRIGDNVLELALDLMKKGIDLMLDPHTFTPSAYLEGTYGTDRTSATFASGKVRFQAGVNIMADLDKAIHRLTYVSHLLVVGSDNVTEGEYVDPDWSDGDTVYRDTLRLDNTIDALIMEEAAAEYVRERKIRANQATFPIRSGGDDVNGYYAAGIHFVAGDYVTLHTGTGEHDYNEQAIQVAAIQWNMHDNGQFIPSVELGSQYVDAQTSAEIRQLSTLIGNHTHPPNPQLCVPGDPPTFDNAAVNATVSTQVAVSLDVAQGQSIILFQRSVVDVAGNGDNFDPTWRPSGVLDGDSQTFTKIYETGAGTTDIQQVWWLTNANAGTNGGGPDGVLYCDGTGYMTAIGAMVVDGASGTPTVTAATGTGSTSSISATGGLVVNWVNAEFPAGSFAAPTVVAGTLGAADSEDAVGRRMEFGIGYGSSSPSWDFGTSRNWTALAVVLEGGTGDGPAWKIGTSIRASRCDHQHYIDEINGLQAALDALESSAGVTDHGALTGLADDDHPQYIKDSEFGAKGRILVGTGSGTYDDLPVGTNGQRLVADSAETTGVTWADASTVTEAEVRDAGRWEPVTNGDVGSPEIVFDDGDVVMEWTT